VGINVKGKKMKDLHLHLSGSTPYEVLWELVCEAGFKIKAKDFWTFKNTLSMSRENVHDLQSYLDVLHVVDKVQSSPQAVEKSVYHTFVGCFLSGCQYQELRWNPTKRSQDGNIDLDKLIVSARAGLERAQVNFGIEGQMILCMGRDCSPKANEAVFDKALKYFEKGVIGIDLAGPYKGTEAPWESQKELFKLCYYAANKNGLITTIHCGEEWHDDIEAELEWVLTEIRPKRIGHGIWISKFPHLMKLAQKENILFEICPSSNLATRAVSSKEELGDILEVFEENKLNFCINTDSTTLIDTNIKKENQIFEEIKALNKKKR
jgi:adenosine deaminase